MSEEENEHTTDEHDERTPAETPEGTDTAEGADPSTTRRGVLTLAGVTGLGILSAQGATAQSGSPHYNWGNDVDANEYALERLGSLRMAANAATIEDFEGENLEITDGVLNATGGQVADDVMEVESITAGEATVAAATVEQLNAASFVGPSDPENVRFWWPCAEGIGEVVRETAGLHYGTFDDARWASGPYVNGTALRGTGDNAVVTTTWGDFGSRMGEDFALYFTFETEDLGTLLGAINSGGAENQTIRVETSSGFSPSEDDKLTFIVRGDSAAGEYGLVNTEADVTDGQRRRVCINKISNDAESWEIWFDGQQVDVTVDNNSLQPDDLVAFDEPITLLASNTRGDVLGGLECEMDNVVVCADAQSEGQIGRDYERQQQTIGTTLQKGYSGATLNTDTV